MTKEDYVSLEVAKMMKEKGFNEKCRYVYNTDHIGITIEKINSELPNGCFSMPTLYEAQKWLWYNYNINVSVFILSPFKEPYKFLFIIQRCKETKDDYSNIISSKPISNYEEALKYGILEALKLI